MVCGRFARRVSLKGDANHGWLVRYQDKLPLELTFQMGSERRAAQIYCAGPFEMTFHSEWISLDGG